MNAILRPAEQRGHANHGWLDTHHSFSFAHYYDPAHMGFRSLRVINDDVITPGTGFGTHGHQDMEIISYVVSGALAHADSMGSQSIIQRGDIQVMSAGTGIRHSEYNASHHENVHFLQIWIMPPAKGLAASYDQTTIPEADKRNRLAVLAGPHQHAPAIPIHQDALVYASLLDKDQTIRHPLAASRGVWIQLITGTICANGIAMHSGDGLSIEDVEDIQIQATTDSEFLLFDLA